MFDLFLTLIGRRPLNSILNRHIREAACAEKFGDFTVVLFGDGSMECWHSDFWSDRLIYVGWSL